MTLNLYSSVAKWIKLKFRKFWKLIPTFVEAMGKKLVWRRFAPHVLNRVKLCYEKILIIGNYECNKG